MDKIKLLIVDDGELTLTKIGSYLSDPKVDIYTSNSGKEALEDIQKNDFSLFIIDVHMKDMDGYELATEIKNVEKETSTPIIICAPKFLAISVGRLFKTPPSTNNLFSS